MTRSKWQSRFIIGCLIACALAPLLASVCCAQSPEFRGFWVDAWGAGILNQGQVDTLLGVPGTSSTGQIRDVNCNAVVVQVRRNCDAAYPSSMGEPTFTGGFNALQAVINAAHDTTGGKKRVEVHAWIVTFRTSGGTVYSEHSDTPTGSLTDYDNYWPSRTDGGTETGDKNLDPGHPLAFDYTVNVAMDIVSNFDVDGIHFDYIRYTANNEGYNPTSVARYNAKYGLSGQPVASNEQWKQWRRDQITQLLRKVYAQTQAVKPWVKVGGSFVTWNPSPTASTRAAFQNTRPYYDVYSDWDAWIQEGIVDCAFPMTYYNWASLPTDYTKWMNFEKDRKFNRHMYVGPGIYLNSLDNAILELQKTRDASPAGNHAEGFCGYSYRTPYNGGNWATFAPRLLSDVTSTWADVPAMPWKTNPTKGHISGTVVYLADGKWVDGATITLTGPENRTQLTDGTGFYAFIDLTPGTYTVTASKTGYPNSVKTATIVIGGVLGNMYVRDFQIGFTGPVITDVQATGVSANSATITWNTDVGASSQVEYGTTTSYGSTSPLDPATLTSHSVTLTGLTPGTIYHYRVISANGDGTTYSGDYTFTTLWPPTIFGVQATAITNNAATIIWTTDQPASSQVEYGLTTGYGLTSTLDTNNVTSHSVLLTGLAQNMLYHYRVTSSNGNGTATSTDYTFSTSGPPSITNVQASYVTSSTATITWTTNSPADSRVYYGLTTGYGGEETNGTLMTSHSVTLSGLTNNTLYHYKCKSVNPYGFAESTDFTFTTSSATHITNVQVTGITSSSATITWTTDQAADTRVNYGATPSYGSLYSSPPLVTSHSATITGLSASTTYHYQCVSVNDNGTASTDDATFTTGSAPPDIIIDNTGATFGGTATWNTATGGYNGDYRWVTNRATSSRANCTWRPTIAVAGYYNVYAIWPAATGNTAHATYQVYYNGGNTSTSVNQKESNMTWVPIATNVQFAVGTAGYVYMTNVTGEANGTTHVIADAVKFVYAAPLGPPTISSIQATNITTTGATITWTTNQIADSVVDYGLTASYGSTQSDAALVNSHSVSLTGLTPGTLYHYRVTSTSPTGTTSSGDLTFTTTLETIVDDADPGASWTGVWTAGTYGGGYGDTYKFADGATSATHTYTWTPSLTRTGNYDVYCWYTSGPNRTAAAQYQIHYSGGTQTVPVNQTINGSQWILMATGLPFSAGTSGYVTVDNNVGTGVVVIADAVKWVYTGGGTGDYNPPIVTIGAPSGTITRTGPISYVVSYTDDTGVADITLSPAGVTLNKTGTADGAVSVTGTGLSERTVTVSGVTGTGTLGISIAAGTAIDGAGNPAFAAGPSATFTVDNTPPTVSIGTPSASVTKGGPISYTVTYSGADAVTLASGDVTLNKTGTANGTVVVSGTGNTTRTVTVSSITGDGTLGISIAAGTASDAIGNAAAAAGPSATFTVDNTAPTISIGAPSASLTTGGPVSYTVTYGGADSVTLAGANVMLNKTGTANGTVAVTGSGNTTRTVTVSGITGDGTLGISIAAGTASDNAGNSAPAAGPSATFAVDNTAPIVGISEPSVSTTKAGPVTYTVGYTGADLVTLAAGNITLNKTGTANGSVEVSGTGNSVRTVSISAITGNGTLGISVTAGTASDTAGNNAPAAGPSTTFSVDNTAPTISISAPSGSAAGGGPVTYTVTYGGADDVSLANANVTLNKTGTADGAVEVSGTGTTTRMITISSITGDGTLGISIAAGTASDSSGNTAPAAGPSATFVVENTAPVMSSVTDEKYTTSTTSLYATWAGSDVGSGIERYEYAVGSTSGGTEVRDWTNAGAATSATIDGLSLTVGQKYYISVRAVDHAGLVSDPMASPGVAVAYTVASVLEAKSKANDTPVALPATMVVTAQFPSCFYFEDTNRVAGIRVEAVSTLVPDQLVTVMGVMGVTADGERAVLDPKITQGAMGVAIQPFLMSSSYVGGSTLGYTPGVTDGKGLNNTGLLVKIAGRVSWDDATTFCVDDGSGLTDGEGHAGIRVFTGALPISYENSYVTVTGVVSLRKVGEIVYPYILMKSFTEQ